MDINEALVQKVSQIAGRLMISDEIACVVGTRSEHGHVGPHVFNVVEGGETEITEVLSALVLEPRYPMAGYCQEILSSLPQGRLGVIVRGCDERALIEMAKLERVNMERVELIGVACTEDQARQCICMHPYPQRIDVGDKVEGIAPEENKGVRSLLELNLDDRFEFWREQFERCIKCYGCRNVCPVCICDECILEEACWVEPGQIPPELSFHLIRTYHIADKCVGCGFCEAACPMDIPLTTLNALLLDKLRGLFEYAPGHDVKQRSPLATTLEEMPLHEL